MELFLMCAILTAVSVWVLRIGGHGGIAKFAFTLGAWAGLIGMLVAVFSGLFGRG